MKSLIPTFSFALFAIGLHMAIMFLLLSDKNIGLLLGIHGFLVFFLVVGQVAMKKVKTIDENKVGMTFLAITIFKMLFSMLFVVLLYRTGSFPKFVLIGNFFGAFFTYLIYEVFIALKELR